MKTTLKHSITINNKKYFYTLKKIGKNTTFFQCDAAHIAQEFLHEDIPALLNDLPNLIMAEKKYKKQQSEMIRFRITVHDKKIIEKQAAEKGYNSLSEYLRDLALGNEKRTTI